MGSLVPKSDVPLSYGFLMENRWRAVFFLGGNFFKLLFRERFEFLGGRVYHFL